MKTFFNDPLLGAPRLARRGTGVCIALRRESGSALIGCRGVPHGVFILRNMHLRILLAAFLLALLCGCETTKLTEDPAAREVDTDTAEIVGSKVVAFGGAFHVFATAVDGTELRHRAGDETSKPWPVTPGVHDFRLRYSAAATKSPARNLVAETKIRADLRAGQRYVVKLRPRGSQWVVFYLVENATGREAATSEPVRLNGLPSPVE